MLAVVKVAFPESLDVQSIHHDFGTRPFAGYLKKGHDSKNSHWKPFGLGWFCMLFTSKLDCSTAYWYVQSFSF